MKKDSDEIANAYNLHGRDYHASRQNGGRLFNEFLDMPATLSLIPEQLKGYKILDAGCDSGIYSRILAGRGAEVIGVDISKTMIEIAKEEKQAHENIEYVVGDISDTNLPNESIDLIICNYVLENIAIVNCPHDKK